MTLSNEISPLLLSQDSPPTIWKRSWQGFKANRLALMGANILILITLCAIFVPYMFTGS